MRKQKSLDMKSRDADFNFIIVDEDESIIDLNCNHDQSIIKLVVNSTIRNESNWISEGDIINSPVTSKCLNQFGHPSAILRRITGIEWNHTFGKGTRNITLTTVFCSLTEIFEELEVSLKKVNFTNNTINESYFNTPNYNEDENRDYSKRNNEPAVISPKRGDS